MIPTALTHYVLSGQALLADMCYLLPGRMLLRIKKSRLWTDGNTLLTERALTLLEINLWESTITCDQNMFGAGLKAGLTAHTGVAEISIRQRPGRAQWYGCRNVFLLLGLETAAQKSAPAGIDRHP